MNIYVATCGVLIASSRIVSIAAPLVDVDIIDDVGEAWTWVVKDQDARFSKDLLAKQYTQALDVRLSGPPTLRFLFQKKGETVILLRLLLYIDPLTR